MIISTRLLLVLTLFLAQLSAVATTVHPPQYPPPISGGAPQQYQMGLGSRSSRLTTPLRTEFSTNTFRNTPFSNVPAPTIFAFRSPFSSLKGQAAANSGNAPAPVQEARVNVPTLSVYPNPARGMVVVSLSQPPGPDYKFRLSNIIGREVRTLSLRPDLASTGIAMNLSDLPAGMYFYSLLVNDKVVSTKRLVLQN